MVEILHFTQTCQDTRKDHDQNVDYNKHSERNCFEYLEVLNISSSF